MYNRQPGTTPVDATVFAERLNRLFAAVRPPGQGSYRNADVLHALARRGYVVSAPYLSQLRSGQRRQPSTTIIRLLAEFFGIQTEYFTTEQSAYVRALDAELGWLQLAHDSSVRDVVTALLTLPARARDELLPPRADEPTDAVASQPNWAATSVAPGWSRAASDGRCTCGKPVPVV